MIKTMHYNSPLGRILLAADEKELTGLWFENSKYFGSNLPQEYRESMNVVLRKTKRWLDIYFAGENPDFLPPVHLIGTPFQKEVWKILLEIPYGKTTTYGEIAERLAKEKGIQRMSARAVGGAVGHNPISILVPCHRVMGKNGSLIGYAAGLDKKVKLLEMEHINRNSLCYPRGIKGKE